VLAIYLFALASSRKNRKLHLQFSVEGTAGSFERGCKLAAAATACSSRNATGWPPLLPTAGQLPVRMATAAHAASAAPSSGPECKPK